MLTYIIAPVRHKNGDVEANAGYIAAEIGYLRSGKAGGEGLSARGYRGG
jgi:hypothetical protein